MSLLDPLPFDAEINEYLQRFTGRDWIFQKIDAWLADPNAGKIFWITGAPGIGKTALAAKLLSTRREVVAVHFCRAGHTQKSDARISVLSIAYQLSTQLPEYEQRLNALHLQSIIAGSDARTLFDRLILQPLSANFPDPQRMLVVLIDALDEAIQGGRNELASFVAAEFAKTPRWLRLVITSRPDPEVMYPLQAIAADPIDAGSLENETDLRSFLLRELRAHLLDLRDSAAVLDRIIERSEGNFLYVEWLRKEVMAGRMSLADPVALPKGLGGVYSQFVTRQWPDIAAFKKDTAPSLDIISAAREPLSLAFLGQLNGWSERQQNDFEITLGSLFAVRDLRIQPFHKSLLDWLTDPSKAGPYFISAADGNRRLTEFCLRQFEQNPSALSDYARGHLPAHLIVDQNWEALEDVLTNLAFLEAKTESAGVFALAADFVNAVAVIPSGRPLERTLRLLEDAVRRELHFIGRHPATLFQCLWNLCWWFDCHEAPYHYSSGSSATTFPWQSDGPKRPPALPLGAGHIVLGGHNARSTLSASPPMVKSWSQDLKIRRSAFGIPGPGPKGWLSRRARRFTPP